MDEEVLELERRFHSSGAQEDEEALIALKLRRGELDQARVEAAARLGYAPACSLLDAPPAPLTLGEEAAKARERYERVGPSNWGVRGLAERIRGALGWPLAQEGGAERLLVLFARAGLPQWVRFSREVTWGPRIVQAAIDLIRAPTPAHEAEFVACRDSDPGLRAMEYFEPNDDSLEAALAWGSRHRPTCFYVCYEFVSAVRYLLDLRAPPERRELILRLVGSQVLDRSAEILGTEEVLAALREELGPWILGTGDPVLRELPRFSPSMRLRLEFLSGPQRGAKLEFVAPRTLVIGRSTTCDVQIDDPNCSRRHCAIKLEEHRAQIKDLESARSTLLNGSPIRHTELRHFDRLKLADTEIEVGLIPEVTELPPSEPAT